MNLINTIIMKEVTILVKIQGHFSTRGLNNTDGIIFTISHLEHEYW